MKEINLREYYPFYNMDVYLEVSDEIAGQLDRFKLDEEAHRVRILRAKAYFSLNRGDGIEKDALSRMGIRSLRFLFWFLFRFWFGRVLIFLDARNTVLSCYNDGTVNALPHA